MTDALKELFKKPETEWSEDDKTAVKSAVDAFASAIDEVCKSHGMAYKSVIAVTENGVVPTLRVVAIETQE